MTSSGNGIATGGMFPNSPGSSRRSFAFTKELSSKSVSVSLCVGGLYQSIDNQKASRRPMMWSSTMSARNGSNVGEGVWATDDTWKMGAVRTTRIWKKKHPFRHVLIVMMHNIPNGMIGIHWPFFKGTINLFDDNPIRSPTAAHLATPMNMVLSVYLLVVALSLKEVSWKSPSSSLSSPHPVETDLSGGSDTP